MPDSESIYPSKVDAWLAIVLITTPSLVIGLGFYLGDLVTIIIGLFTAAGFAALAIPCRYTLTNKHLLIQCGFLRERIQLKNIRDAILTSDPLSAPALSLQRVKIELSNSFRLISPRDRECFICELKQKIENDQRDRESNLHDPGASSISDAKQPRIPKAEKASSSGTFSDVRIGSAVAALFLVTLSGCIPLTQTKITPADGRLAGHVEGDGSLAIGWKTGNSRKESDKPEIDIGQSYVIGPDGKRYSLQFVPSGRDIGTSYWRTGSLWLVDQCDPQSHRRWHSGAWTMRLQFLPPYSDLVFIKDVKVWTFFYNPIIHGPPN